MCAIMISVSTLEFKVSDDDAEGKTCQFTSALMNMYSNKSGQSICMGGYENNPHLLHDPVPKDFHFGLYDLDYSVFDTHIEGAVKLCPTFGEAGIKSTICGPESFTPDHKPLMVG